MNKLLIVIGVSLGSFVVLSIIAVVILGSIVPETYVYLGHETPKEYMSVIRSLKLLEEDEKVRYFYTDAFIDIKGGFYFASDRKVVVYSNNWEIPETIVPYEDIEDLSAEYDESFFTDSIIYISTKSGMEITFPVSSEKGRDKKVYEFIENQIKLKQDNNAASKNTNLIADS